MVTKTDLIVLFSLLFIVISCEQNEKSDNGIGIPKSSVTSFSECVLNEMEADSDPTLHLSYCQGGYLAVTAGNTEFCCGTDSVSIVESTSSGKIYIELVDQGPYTWCFCPHELTFRTGPLEEKNYTLRFIESENSYSRDTFYVDFLFDENLDKIVTNNPDTSLLCDNPFKYEKTIEGGCNVNLNSADADDFVGVDTLIFSAIGDSLTAFAGLNLTCCSEFSTESDITGDTLLLRVITVVPGTCNCICYYGFQFIYSQYHQQQFYYKLYLDSDLKFEGTCHLP